MRGSDVLRYAQSPGGWVTAVLLGYLPVLHQQLSHQAAAKKSSASITSSAWRQRPPGPRHRPRNALYVAVHQPWHGGLRRRRTAGKTRCFSSLLKMIRDRCPPCGFSPSLSAEPACTLAAAFGAIYVLTHHLERACGRSASRSPIELLHGGKRRRARARRRQLDHGRARRAVALGAGYALSISVTTESPVARHRPVLRGRPAASSSAPTSSSPPAASRLLKAHAPQ